MKIIEELKYRNKLKKLLEAKTKISKEYEEVESSLKYPGDDQGHLSYLAQKEHEYDCGIDLYKTDYLKSVTEKLIIPMPELGDEKLYYKFDFDDEYGERHILTTLGFHQVITSIRQEEKRKREVVAFWFTILMGLIGATTGLISIIKN